MLLSQSTKCFSLNLSCCACLNLSRCLSLFCSYLNPTSHYSLKLLLFQAINSALSQSILLLLYQNCRSSLTSLKLQTVASLQIKAVAPLALHEVPPLLTLHFSPPISHSSLSLQTISCLQSLSLFIQPLLIPHCEATARPLKHVPHLISSFSLTGSEFSIFIGSWYSPLSLTSLLLNSKRSVLSHYASPISLILNIPVLPVLTVLLSHS